MKFIDLPVTLRPCSSARVVTEDGSVKAVPLAAYERVEQQVYGSVTFSHSPDALLFFDVKQAALRLFERSGR